MDQWMDACLGGWTCMCLFIQILENKVSYQRQGWLQGELVHKGKTQFILFSLRKKILFIHLSVCLSVCPCELVGGLTHPLPLVTLGVMWLCMKKKKASYVAGVFTDILALSHFMLPSGKTLMTQKHQITDNCSLPFSCPDRK